MPAEKEEPRETLVKSVRLYVEDMEYLVRILQDGPIAPGLCIRDAVHQLVEMCRRNNDRFIYPSVFVPRKDAMEAGLIEEEKKS
jgi:hypothetical protein